MQAFEQLEVDFAHWLDLDPQCMVACASGSAALHLALEALQLPQGSQVIVPTFNMIACARAVTLAGLKPVFVDCGEDLLMDQDLWFEAIDDDTCTLMFVHIYGRMCTIPRIWDGYIVEDLAEAHGIKPHPKTDAATWSFYKNKCVHGEEGGAVYFRNPAHAALARQLRSLGFTDAHDFNHVPRGWNHRMSNVHAELVLASLAHADENLARRREIEAMYDRHCPDEWRMPRRDSVWVYDIRIPGLTREKQAEIVRTLNANGIMARMSFLPMHLQTEYRHCKCIGGEVAERMADEVFYLPVQPGITQLEHIEKAFAIIQSAVGG